MPCTPNTCDIIKKLGCSVLRTYTIQCYLMDCKWMENGVFIGEDYFEKLLEEILLSECQFYLLSKKKLWRIRKKRLQYTVQP